MEGHGRRGDGPPDVLLVGVVVDGREEGEVVDTPAPAQVQSEVGEHTNHWKNQKKKSFLITDSDVFVILSLFFEILLILSIFIIFAILWFFIIFVI